MNKLRVAFFGDDFSRRGKGTALVIQKIAEELVRSQNADVTLLRPQGACSSVICEKVKTVFISRRYSTALSYLWFFMRHKDPYDCVVFNRVLYPGFWMLNSNKKILFLHDASVSEVYMVPRTFANHCFEYFIKYIGKHFLDAVIAASHDAKKWISVYFSIPPEKIHVIYNGVSDEYSPFGDGERAEARSSLEKKYGIRSPYILDVSRFDPHKNIDRTLDAFFLCKEKDKIPHTLVFVGGRHTNTYSDLMEEKIRNSGFSGSVQVIDYVEAEDMPFLYNCADIFLYPSLVEGFGLPVLEAMRCGVPVVTSNASSLPEIAAHAAVLVDPLDVGSIARGVYSLLSDHSMRQQMIERGLKRSAEFSWKKTADEFLKCIKK